MKNLLHRSIPVFLALFCSNALALADTPATGGTPKPLIDTSSPDAIKQIKENYGDPVFAIDKGAITVTLPAARANYPGIQIFPPGGAASWDLSSCGHVEATLTNTGSTLLRETMRVDGQVSGAPASDTEIIGIKPGETKVLKVIFGAAWGYKPSAAIDPSKIERVILFATKSTQDQSFRIENLQGAGPPGEKPPFNPDYVVNKPPNGVILGPGVTFDPAKQVIAHGVQVSAGAGGGLSLSFKGGGDETIDLKPAMGTWDLRDDNEIRVKFKNTGDTPVTPSASIGSNTVSTSQPLAAGAEAEVVVPFEPLVTPVCASDYKAGLMPGTGTKFENNKVRQISIGSDTTAGAKNVLVESIIADAPVAQIPDWLGKKPPVDGDWTQTFDEEFNGPTIDTSKWNYYGHNFWDKRSHFSKDNLILKDGKVFFHYEKKTGYQNDDPHNVESTHKTAYAVGFLNTFGKWTQRYGYFESRMKLPTAPGLWPAFWLMPDRGHSSYKGHYRVGTALQPGVDTGNGGMEFDIMEFLSGWGPYRFNIAMHWDGYGKLHKATGSEDNYVQADKDGFITSGLLWTPGSAIYYCNGKEILRWENPRVSDEQEYIMYDMVSGGWDNLPLDDAKLPDDFVVDYCRVWQRKDLATPDDGPKPNKGDPSELKN
jgi:beta-glucanase (GH16 family)